MGDDRGVRHPFNALPGWRRGTILPIVWLSFAAGSLAALPGATAQMMPPSLAPQRIAMGTFYDGSRIHVTGTAPSGSGILIVFRGSEQDEFFDCKGREGFIWLNADKIHVKHAPSLFLTFGSGSNSALLDPLSLNRYVLDEGALAARIRCLRHCKCNRTGNQANEDGARDQVPDPAYAKMLLTSFFALKEHEGRYAARAGAVRLKPENGETRYSLQLEWPKSALPGKYQVEVYACRDHGVIARSATVLEVAEIGFPAYMANLSTEHRWIYGICAVLAAMLAGFGIDGLTSRFRRSRSESGTGGSSSPPANSDEATEPNSEIARLNTPVSRR